MDNLTPINGQATLGGDVLTDLDIQKLKAAYEKCNDSIGQRVLRARLSDARYFYNVDIKVSMDEWVEKLDDYYTIALPWEEALDWPSNCAFDGKVIIIDMKLKTVDWAAIRELSWYIEDWKCMF